MKVSEKIRKSLIDQVGWDAGDANAAAIYKGHGRDGWGWYVRPFNSQEILLGEDWVECTSTLDRMAEEYLERQRMAGSLWS